VNANVNATAKDGVSALFAAAATNSHDMCLLLLDAKATITADEFVQAAVVGNEQTCRAFIAANGDVNAQQSSGGWFPLLAASEHNHISVCKHLLHARAKPNVTCNDGFSSLMYAAGRGHCEVVRLLLQEGANACLRSKNIRLGATALFFSAAGGHRDACALLLRADPSIVHLRDHLNAAVWDVATANSHITTAQLLRDWRAVDAFVVGSRKSWLLPLSSLSSSSSQHKQQEQLYCWARSPLFDVHLINEVTSFLTDEDNGKRRWCAQCCELHQKARECGACRTVAYCSPQCQKKHWIAVHRGACRIVMNEARLIKTHKE
jgi:hypothetical protein